MALSLIQQPDDVALARNQMLFKLRATAPGGGTYAAKGASATLTTVNPSRFTVGATLTVSITPPGGLATTIIFTAAADYSADNAIPAPTFSGTSAEYWAAVQGKIAGHPQLGAAVAVTLSYGASIILTVRLLDVLPAGSVTLANSPGYTVASQAATADATPDNYRVLFEVVAQKGYRTGSWVVAATAQGLPDVDGYLSFDIGPTMAAHCKAWRNAPVVPVFGTDTPLVADNLRRYQVRFTEESGTPPTQSPWTVLPPKLALDGGVSDTLAAGAGFLSTLNANNSLLSWMPTGRKIGLQQPEYLPWYNYTGTNKLVTLERITYDVDNGAASSKLYFYEAALTVRPGETLLIPMAAALDSLANDRYKIEVRVVDKASDYEGGNPTYLSQSRTYYIDRDYYSSVRYIQYLNSFGCPECWRCTGIFSERLNVARSTAAQNLGPNYGKYAVDSLPYDTKGTPALTYRTGYLRKSEAEVLKEMLLAAGVYDVTPDGYIPLLLTTNDFDITDTLRDLHAYAFATKPRIGQRIFSKTAITTGGDENAWLEPGSAAWFDSILQPWAE